MTAHIPIASRMISGCIPEATEVLSVVGISKEPAALIDELIDRGYERDGVIEALQRGIERGKITLNSAGYVAPCDRLGGEA